MKEALKLALESMKRIDAWLIQRGYTGLMPKEKEAITALEASLAQKQEPVAWKFMPRDATDSMLKAMDECSTEGYDERLYAGHAASVYMAAWDEAPITPQRTWEQPEERNFCPRCGKRTADLTVIHTCTPPQQDQETVFFGVKDQGVKVSSLEFVTRVMGKEEVIGKPIFWAEWPSKEPK